MVKNKKRNRLIPYDVIEAAIQNDAEAIYVVLKYYEQYINKLSAQPYSDSFGREVMIVDEDLQQMLKITLANKIQKFKI